MTLAAIFDHSGHHAGRNTAVFVVLVLVGCALLFSGNKR